MKTVACWEDLARYGIEALTGEACGLSYRLLCDVTAKGKAVLAKFLGAPDLALPPAWNRGSEGAPHENSIRQRSGTRLQIVKLNKQVSHSCRSYVWLN